MPSAPEDGRRTGPDEDDPAARLLVGRPLSPQDVVGALGAGSQSAFLVEGTRLRDAPPACRLLLVGAGLSVFAALSLGIWWLLVYGPPFGPSLSLGELVLAGVCVVLPLAALLVAASATRGRRASAAAALPLTVAMAAAGAGQLVAGHSLYERGAAAVFLMGCVLYGAGAVSVVASRRVGAPSPAAALPGDAGDASPEQLRVAQRAEAAALVAFWLDSIAGLVAGAVLLAVSAWWSLAVPVAGHTGPGRSAVVVLLLTALPAAALVAARVRWIIAADHPRVPGLLVVWPLAGAFFACVVTLPYLGSFLLGMLYACLVFVVLPGQLPRPQELSASGEVPTWLTAGRTRRQPADDDRPRAPETPEPYVPAWRTTAEAFSEGASDIDAPVVPEAPEAPPAPY